MLTQKTSGPSVLQTGRVLFLPLGAIRPNPAQPRSVFDAAGLQELAASIRQYGVLQPLSVRKKGSGFELVAGERRLRAAGLAGLREVPCLLVSADDQDAGLLALVENLQRRDLDYIEQAQGLARLMQQYHLTQEQAARRVGKSQSAIANKLRLLRLTPEEREIIMKYNLTERHARALLRLAAPSERLAVLEKTVKYNLNVEKTEAAVEEMIGQRKTRESYKKRSKVFQNVRIFVNTIAKAVETMQAAGIAADSQKIQREDYIEYRVRIPIGERR